MLRYNTLNFILLYLNKTNGFSCIHVSHEFIKQLVSKHRYLEVDYLLYSPTDENLIRNALEMIIKYTLKHLNENPYIIINLH